MQSGSRAVADVSQPGLDLREPLSEAAKRTVYDAVIRYPVLCFRDQHLSEERQIAFTRQFGTLYRSDDLGESWRRVDHGVTAEGTMTCVTVSRADPRRVYCVSRCGQVFGIKYDKFS